VITALEVLAQASDLAEGKLSGRAQAIAVAVAILVLLFVLELVRRRRLVERYALLWMFAAAVAVVLSVWTDGLGWIADRLGIASPPNALFLLGLVAIFGLLLNFSVAISRLSEETKILAQTVSRLDAELRETRGEGPRANGHGADADAERGRARRGEPRPDSGDAR
jgi:hypothetical protein